MPAPSQVRTTNGRGRLFDSVLDTVGDTPCIRINNVAPKSVRMYVKAEAFNPAASVKDRLALNIIEAAERNGTLRPGQTVVEATSGNTGIGLAMVCAQKNHPLVVTMADSFSIERRRLMRVLGAKVVLTPRAAKPSGCTRRRSSSRRRTAGFSPRQFETDANAEIHESTTAREIIGDFKDERLDYFVTGYGTGGTVAGVARVLRRERPETKIILSEPANAQLVGSGKVQPRGADGSPAASHAAFEPHPIQGWTPDFIPLVLQEAIDKSYYDELSADRRRRGGQVGQGAGAEGGNLLWHFQRRHVRRRDADRREGSARRRDSGDAPRHRRALPEHAALRGDPGGHGRGRARDLEVDAGTSDALGAGAEQGSFKHSVIAGVESRDAEVWPLGDARTAASGRGSCLALPVQPPLYTERCIAM